GGGATAGGAGTAGTAALAATLPDPARAPDRKSRRVATHLARLRRRAAAALAGAASASGAKQTRLYRKARSVLVHLVAVATAAEANGTLDASLTAIETATTALQALIPSA